MKSIFEKLEEHFILQLRIFQVVVAVLTVVLVAVFCAAMGYSPLTIVVCIAGIGIFVASCAVRYQFTYGDRKL